MAWMMKTVASPVGELRLVASATGLVALLWQHDLAGEARLREQTRAGDSPVLAAAGEQLRRYFAGKLQAFTVPLEFYGTPFQRSVWQALCTIPYGQTRSYAQIAQQIGSPRAVRAVGAANGKNPISIIAPCHRVIGANGTLTGFGGGLPRKKKLLLLEGAALPADDSA